VYLRESSVPSVVNTTPAHAPQMAALQRKVFPTLAPAELMQEAHYLRHLEVFPEGQWAALDGDRVVGMTTTMRYHFSTAQHTFLEVSDNLWMGTHEPDGEWLYGLDMGVDPDYRGLGIARALYEARQALVQRLGLRGQVIVGLLSGYAAVSSALTVEAYFDLVRTGVMADPTVTAQQKMGFQIVAFMPQYVDDPSCGHAGVLMTRMATDVIGASASDQP
jgi:GNAT superfamily N-acetyltransferase